MLRKRPVNVNLMGASPSSPRSVRRGGNAVNAVLGYKVRCQRLPRGSRVVADVLPIVYTSHEALKGEIIDLALHPLVTVVSLRFDEGSIEYLAMTLQHPHAGQSASRRSVKVR